MKALKRDKIPTPLQQLGTREQDPIHLQESVKRNQFQLQSSKKDTTPTPLQESVERNQSQQQSSKKDRTPTLLQELAKRNQPQLQSSKKDRNPTPLQLLIKEMPGETVPHSLIYAFPMYSGTFSA